MAQPRCPRCAHPLQALGIPVGTSLGCGHCGGVLLDDAAFGHVRTQLYSRILEQAPTEAASPPLSADTSPPLACPACARGMTRTEVEHVFVDYCSEHGTWFDRDELVAVARACAVSRAYGRRAATPTSREDGEGPGRVLTAEEREALARSVADRGAGALVTDGVSAQGLLDAFVNVTSRNDDD